MKTLDAGPPIALLQWCATCSTQHGQDERCPGRLVPVEPERHGWRVNVETVRGIDAYGVLLARCTEGFRARILTYPNILWLVPGGAETMKFAGPSAAEAEARAAEFIRKHCQSKGLKMRSGLSAVPFYGVDPEGALETPTGEDPQDRPARRKIRFLPVRFGVAGATEAGGTGNLSESGMFIITNSPLDSGQRVLLALNLDRHHVVRMIGDVVWMRTEHHVGRAPGMGVQLDTPPGDYLDYVRNI